MANNGNKEERPSNEQAIDHVEKFEQTVEESSQTKARKKNKLAYEEALSKFRSKYPKLAQHVE